MKNAGLYVVRNVERTRLNCEELECSVQFVVECDGKHERVVGMVEEKLMVIKGDLCKVRMIVCEH